MYFFETNFFLKMRLIGQNMQKEYYEITISYMESVGTNIVY